VSSGPIPNGLAISQERPVVVCVQQFVDAKLKHLLILAIETDEKNAELFFAADQKRFERRRKGPGLGTAFPPLIPPVPKWLFRVPQVNARGCRSIHSLSRHHFPITSQRTIWQSGGNPDFKPRLNDIRVSVTNARGDAFCNSFRQTEPPPAE
jgi:hypothetical protein